jgi:hypothetical protein
MISVRSSFYNQDKWLAFPGFLVSLVGLSNQFSIKFFVNRPGLEHWFLVIKTNSPNENLFRYGQRKFASLSGIHFGRYTIISARTQGKLNRKLNPRGVYERSSYLNNLNNLKWVSVNYCWTSNEIIKFMESPILLFDSSRLSNLALDWCSAFISFLSFGFLNINVSYGSFSLGKVLFRFCDLLGD